MKKVYVLRHANRDFGKDSLNEEGKQKALQLKNKFNHFDLVFSSPFERCKQTANLLTDKEPKVDERAGILEISDEQKKKITDLRKSHPFGVAGAILSLEELHESARKAGQKLLDLVKEVLSKLPEDGKGLIISHDGTMVTMEKILKEETFSQLNKTYHELEGFVVDEQLRLETA